MIIRVFLLLVLLSLMLSVPTTAQEVATFAYRINGHTHNMEYDFVDRAIQEWYDVAMDSLDITSLIDSLAQGYNFTLTDFTFPEDISVMYAVDSTGANDFMGILVQNSISATAYGYDSYFDIEMSHVGLSFGGVGEFDNGTYQIDLMEPRALEPHIVVTDSGGTQGPLLADILKGGLTFAVLEYVKDLAAMFDSLATDELFVLLNPIESLGIEDPELLEAALESFPLEIALYTEYDIHQEIVQLIAEFNFLTGTTENPAAFIGIEPDNITGSQLETGGFSFLYWGLQRGFQWHPEWDETQRVNEAFSIMDELDLDDYRVEMRWNDVQTRAYLGNTPDPAEVTSELSDHVLGDSAHWDTTAFANMQTLLENGLARGLSPFMAIGVGHQDRLPTDENGLIIAPATETWDAPEGYVGVSAAEYLYNLKIYAFATVRRFADFVNVWQVENELNAAGWAAANPGWWRKGDLWLDANFRDMVWGVLVDAIRSEDPTALLTHDFHILGFMFSLERWLDDLDIVGFNYYPNQVNALPNLGFSVGEYAWAVRRALKGLHYPDKPVWLIETGYPGIEIHDPQDSLLLADDALYFSENRQKEYIETALTSAVDNGINGFFYFNLTAPENFDISRPELSQNMRFCGLIRRDIDEPKAALIPFADLFNRLVVTTGIERQRDMQPHSLVLHQNFPNPFNPSTTVSYELPAASWVSLRVINILGGEITTLVDEYQEAGHYRVTWNGTNYANGIYFVKIQADNFVQTRKMIIAK